MTKLWLETVRGRERKAWNRDQGSIGDEDFGRIKLASRVVEQKAKLRERSKAMYSQLQKVSTTRQGLNGGGHAVGL